MKKVCVSVKCKPSGDIYFKRYDLGAAKYPRISLRGVVAELMRKAMMEHDLFESYKVEIDPIPEDK